MRPYEKLLDDTEEVVQCRNFLLENVKKLGINSGTAMMIGNGPKKHSACVNGPCHALLNVIPNIKVCCGAVNPNREQFEVTMRFLEWLIHKSPYEDMFKDGFEIVWGEDDLPKGFIFSEECCKKFPGDLFKNLFILLRCIQEVHPSFQAWDCLVSNGMHPDDAFFVIRVISLVGDNQFGVGMWQHYDGWHWPIWAQSGCTEKFDFDAWYAHKPNLGGRIRIQRYNKFWMTNGTQKAPFEFKNKLPVKKTRFSKITVADTAYVISEFEKFKEVNGIKGPKKVDDVEENLDY